MSGEIGLGNKGVSRPTWGITIAGSPSKDSVSLGSCSWWLRTSPSSAESYESEELGDALKIFVSPAMDGSGVCCAVTNPSSADVDSVEPCDFVGEMAPPDDNCKVWGECP